MVGTTQPASPPTVYPPLSFVPTKTTRRNRWIFATAAAVLLLIAVIAAEATNNPHSSSFASDLGAMGADQKPVANDAIARDWPALEGACQQLLGDVTRLKGDAVPSTFTSAMQIELTNIINYQTQGANDCIQAVRDTDQAKLESAVSLFSAAGTLEHQLSQQISGNSGNSGQGSSNALPTTTTTTTTTVPPTTTTTMPPTTTTTVQLPPVVQKFVDDVENQFPAIGTSISSGADNGLLTNQSLADEGESICTLFSEYSAPSSGIGGDPYDLVTTNVAQQLMEKWSVGSQSYIFVDVAIEDLCPAYASDIPPEDSMP